MASTATSDFVALFYRQFSDGVVAPQLSVSSSFLLLRQAISERLKLHHQLQFETLPGLLQRALLWDAGFVFSGGGGIDNDDSQLVQIWTRCDSSMADISIHSQEFAQASMTPSCTIESCSPTGRGDSSEVPFISQCDLKAIEPLMKCTISEASRTDIPARSNTTLIWSHESSTDLEVRVPSFTIIKQSRHNDAEDGDNSPGTLYSIHTARGSTSSSLDTRCPQSLIIPCLPLAESAIDNSEQHPQQQQWCRPQSHPLLETWLKEYASTSTTATITSPASSFSWSPSKLITSALTESSINTEPAVYIDNELSDASSALASQDDPIAMTSDLVRHYFRLHARGGSLSLKLESDVPPEILARLEPYQLTFHDLSGLVQRALIWDSGYALTLDIHGKTRLVEIKVRCGLRMADIALNAAYYESAGCSYDDCSTANATSNMTLYSYRAPRSCKIEQLECVSLCAAVAPTDTTAIHSNVKDESSLWAIGNLSSASRDTVLGMRATRRIVNASIIYTIDANENANNEVQFGQCPARPALTIPCIAYDKVSRQSEWCRPIQGDLVAAWIADEERQYMALINLIVLTGAVLLAVAMDLFIDLKPQSIRTAAVGVAVPSLDSADMDITEQSVQQSIVLGWSSAWSSNG